VSDRELLELAAKAAGIDYRHDNSFWTHEDYCAFWSYDDLCNCGARWNPLTDDGDALRLAVKLGLALEFRDCGRRIYAMTDGYEIGIALDPDSCAATRRAITRAAAEIGRNMK
jgi:hypothetical protein